MTIKQRITNPSVAQNINLKLRELVKVVVSDDVARQIWFHAATTINCLGLDLQDERDENKRLNKVLDAKNKTIRELYEKIGV